MALTLQKVAQTQIDSPPGTFFQIREVIEDPDGSFEQISDIISSDPSLAARLLKIVNSPFYGFSTKIETIPHALGIVGSNQISELALATSMISKFEGIPEDLLNIDQFWQHSIACGVAARQIAQKMSMKQPERFYVMGMLHDLGKLVLLKEIPEQYAQVLAEAQADPGTSLIELERQQLRFNHAQVGWVLLKEWKLPPSLVSVVNHHHEPLKASDFVIEASIIHVADFLAYEMGLRDGCETHVPQLCKKTLKILDLNLGFINKIKSIVEDQTFHTLNLFMADA